MPLLQQGHSRLWPCWAVRLQWVAQDPQGNCWDGESADSWAYVGEVTIYPLSILDMVLLIGSFDLDVSENGITWWLVLIFFVIWWPQLEVYFPRIPPWWELVETGCIGRAAVEDGQIKRLCSEQVEKPLRCGGLELKCWKRCLNSSQFDGRVIPNNDSQLLWFDFPSHLCSC